MKKLLILFAVLFISTACVDENEIKFEVRYTSNASEMLMIYFDETMEMQDAWIGQSTTIKKRIMIGQYYRASAQAIGASVKVEILVNGKVVRQATAQPLEEAVVEGRF